MLITGGNAEGLLGGTRVAQYDAARGDFEKWDSLYTDRFDFLFIVKNCFTMVSTK